MISKKCFSIFINQEQLLKLPLYKILSINYSEKTRAKLIFGKKGKNDGDLVWPCDVSINHFNKQILVSDSGVELELKGVKI